MKKRFPLVATLALATTAALAPCAFAQNSFTVTRLGTLSGGDTPPLSVAFSLNNSGQVVGNSNGVPKTPLFGLLYGFVWDANSGMQYVFDTQYPAPAFETGALDINAGGTVLGDYTDANGNSGYFLDTNGVYTYLQPATSNGQIAPHRINSLNQTVGSNFTLSPRMTQATLWDAHGVPATLTVPGTGSVAYGINDTGQVVGDSFMLSTSPAIPFLWDAIHGGQALPYLGVGGGARAISNNGTIAGYVQMQIQHSSVHAATWSQGGVTDIQQIGVASEAVDINDAGQVIGEYAPTAADDTNFYSNLLFGRDYGFYYANGKMHDLLEMTDASLPYTNLVPFRINANGQIAAAGYVFIRSYFGYALQSVEAVLLTPSQVVLPQPVDITSQFNISVSSTATYDRLTKLWNRDVTLTNRSQAAFSGPFFVVYNADSPAFLSTPTPTGVTRFTTPSGFSYLTVNANGGKLAPGAALTLRFSYSLPALQSGTQVTILRVYNGQGRL